MSFWDSRWRSGLADNLEVLAKKLWQVGIREIYADGSFLEDKDHPNDIDGYFVCGLRELASGDWARQLNLLDPFKVWTWGPVVEKALSRISEETTAHVAPVPS